MYVSKRATMVAAISVVSGIVSAGAGSALAASRSAPIMTVLTPSSITAGSTNNNLSFKVQAKQSFTGGSITFTLPSGAWSAPSGTTVSAQKGTCATTPAVTTSSSTFGATGVNCGTNKYFVVIFKTTAPTGAGSYSFSYSFTSSAGSQSGSLAESVTAASASKLKFVDPAVNNAIAGAALTTGVSQPVKVRVEDQYGNLVNSTASITIAPSKNATSFSGTASRNAVAGVATFSDLSLTRADSGYTLSATSGALTSATSSAFAVTHAALSMSFSTQPANTVAGATMSDVVVNVSDTYGNPGSGPVSVALDNNPRSATLSGTTSQALDGSGNATFNDLSVDVAEQGATLAASDSADSLSNVSSDPFDVTLAIVRPSSSAGSYWEGAGLGTLGWNFYQYYFWANSGATDNHGPYTGDPFGTFADAQSYAEDASGHEYTALPADAASAGWVWEQSSADTRALDYLNSYDSAACWYGDDFNVTVAMPSGGTKLTMYVVDWDSYGPRDESITVDDGSGPQPVQVTAFDGGAYISAPVAAGSTVTIHLKNNAGPGSNAVISGIFVD